MAKKMAKTIVVILVVLVVVAVVAWYCAHRQLGPQQDEAKLAGKTPADFPQAADDYFRDMDGGVKLTADQVKGRNTWLIWTGGNEAFWDWLANNSFGTFDLLKTLGSYPCSSEPRQGQPQPAGGETPYYTNYSRDTRFHYLGLMNEPGFRKATKPDEFGLCLDERVAPPEPFDPKVYGRASGVAGLRLYPNPNFDERASHAWSAEKFYTDLAYYTDPKLVRPYRVGMSCAFCHISHHPDFPPADPERPEWRNLSGTIGAQYFWFGRIFGANLTKDNFVWHYLDSRPGAVDTSFIPADNLNNPRAMNAVFNLPARLQAGERFHQEKIGGGALALPEVQRRGSIFGVPHVLWDGSDSVGIDAALTRVYINIGEYHQEWLRHIQVILGGTTQTPISVKVAQENSVYWNATQERAANLKDYLVHAANPMPLKAAPDSERYLRGNRDPAAYESLLGRGKVAFAETCARCHSSKIPSPAPGLDDGVDCNGSRYLDCWNRYWQWTETPDFKRKMTEMVLAKDFLDDNYLSTDARIPVTLLETEICSSMASNAVGGHVWGDFSSESYKSLPAVGEIKLWDPVRQQNFTWPAPGGGRGYQRVPSLISIWSTAPFLHNNEVGKFTSDPSVAGRMAAFDDAIHKLLWPQRRENRVQVTDRKTYIKVSTKVLPEPLQPLLEANPVAGFIRWALGLGWLVGGEDIVQVGPIPKGTPVSLLTNLLLDKADPRFDGELLIKTLLKAKHDFSLIDTDKLSDAQATELLKGLEPDLIKLSACPDFVVDRGHYFGKELSDEDKEALIEFLKTL